jgi:cytidyltransferase-like protein
MSKVVVIYPGGFQPFHQGHLSSYQQAKKAFPNADFYVATSANVKERPIPYNEKKFLATQAGVNPADFPDIVVKSPLNPREILDKYNPNQDIFILVRSERDPVPYTKKDGSPAYYQPFTGYKNIQPFGEHGYVYVTDKHDFIINGKNVFSGTELRQMYANADDSDRMEIIKQLYPNSKEHNKIKEILDMYLSNNQVNESLENFIKQIKPLLPNATAEQKQKIVSLLEAAKKQISKPKVKTVQVTESADYLPEK